MSKHKTPQPRAAKASRERAVLATLREGFQARSPGMPAALRDKILASVKPAPRPPRKKTTTFFFGMGWTGALLAACLSLAVGIAWYKHAYQAPGMLNAVKTEPGAWQRARDEAPALLSGRLALEEPEVGVRPEPADRRWTLEGVRSTETDAGPAAWFVFTDGRTRMAVLWSAVGPDARDLTGQLDQPLVRAEAGLVLAGRRDSGRYLIAVGGSREETLEFLRGLEWRMSEPARTEGR